MNKHITKKILKTLIALCCALLTLLLSIANITDDNKSVASAECIVEETSVPSTQFSIYYCSKEEFISYCLEHHIRPDKIEYVWDLLRGQYSVDELAQKYYLEYDAVKRDRWKYKKKLLKSVDKKT